MNTDINNIVIDYLKERNPDLNMEEVLLSYITNINNSNEDLIDYLSNFLPTSCLVKYESTRLQRPKEWYKDKTVLTALVYPESTVADVYGSLMIQGSIHPANLPLLEDAIPVSNSKKPWSIRPKEGQDPLTAYFSIKWLCPL